MTKLKIQGSPGASAQSALEPHIARIYAKPGIRVLGVLELKHEERSQAAPESDKQDSVTMKITHLEIPTRDQEGVLREAMRTLYLQRTARGTLDEDGQLTLDENALSLAAGQLPLIDSATIRAAVHHWCDYGARVNATQKLTETELRHELGNIVDGLRAALSGTPDSNA
jgi:hypothetical protein